MPLSKRVDRQRSLGLYCFFLYVQNIRTPLVPCIFRLKKIRKDGGIEERETGSN